VKNSIVLAEWAAPYAGALASSWVEISIARPVGDSPDLDSDEPREVSLSAHGEQGDLFDRLRAASEDFDVSRS
jgi:hypothetical protein